MTVDQNLAKLLAREPPQDTEAEHAVLASILIDPIAIYATDSLDAADFYLDEHRIIFTAMQVLREAGKPTHDARVLISHLKATGEYEKVGGATYLRTMVDAADHTSSIKEYVDIVRDCSRQRQLLNLATRVFRRAYDRDDPDAIIEEVDARLAGIGSNAHEYTTTLLEDGLRRIERFQSGDKDDVHDGVIKTGIPGIDDHYGGLKRGHSIVIGARPSDGKSALGKQIASNVAESGVPVLLVTLEMEASEIADRVWAQRLGIDGRYMEANCFVENEFLEFQSAVHSDGSANFYVSAPTGKHATWSRISGHATMMHATKGIGLIVIDYLQLVEKANDRQKPYETVTEASKGAKSLARKLKVPVVSLAQVSRETEKGSRREPRLADLRDSGAIEQDADVVIFLHRIEENQKDFRMIVAKWRNGDKSKVPITLDGKHTQFLPGNSDNDGF